MAKSKKSRKETLSVIGQPPKTDQLLGDIRSLIEQSREQVARAVNTVLVKLYWQIGRRIRQDVLAEQRAEYGEQIVANCRIRPRIQSPESLPHDSVRPGFFR
jgi:hypothetical protein